MGGSTSQVSWKSAAPEADLQVALLGCGASLTELASQTFDPKTSTIAGIRDYKLSILRTENFKLTLASDKELRMWFSANSKSLDNLCNLLRAKSNGSAFYVSRDDKKFSDAAELLRKLNLSAARVEANGDAEIIIGGVTDNTVGFVNSPSKNPPKITPSSSYIWVEEVAANWYLFRTT